ncbi:MAG: hypothetical protein Fur0032_18820 [Terrimicrobiaceae bacterium]
MLNRLAVWAANLFPVWVLATGLFALLEPSWFSWLRGNWIVWGLTAVMLGMGATLRCVSGHFKMHHLWSLQSAPPWTEIS